MKYQTFYKCPVCGKDETEVVFTKGDLNQDLNNVVCKNCGLVYINPRPLVEEYEKYHMEEFYKERNYEEINDITPRLKKSDFLMKEKIFLFLKKYLKKEFNILDVGFGFGTLLSILKKNLGCSVCGVETSKLGVETAKKYYKLSNVYHDTFDNFSAREENKEKFDFIILHHVFEHFPNPLDELKKLQKILKPDGLIYMGVPNVLNMQRRAEIFFQKCHPFSYSPYSFSLMAQKANFKIIDFQWDAAYPCGMDFIITSKENQNFKRIDFKKIDSKRIIGSIKKNQLKFSALRAIRNTLLFFLPKNLKIKLTRPFYKYLRKGINIKKMINNKKFFLAVCLASIVVGTLYGALPQFLRYKNLSERGLKYEIANFDGAWFYLPRMKDVLEGKLIPDETGTFEHQNQPYFNSILGATLISPFLVITKSISSTIIVTGIIFPILTFLTLVFLMKKLTGNRWLSLFLGFVLMLFPQFSLLIPPSSFNEVKILIKHFLPFQMGEPVINLLFERRESMIPGAPFFVGTLFLIYTLLSTKKEGIKKYFLIIFTGLFFGLQFYIYTFFWVFVTISLGLIGFLLLINKSFKKFVDIFFTFLCGFFFSIPFWINQISFSNVPQYHDIIDRFGVERSYDFRWIFWKTYLLYLLLGIFIIWFEKKYTKKMNRGVFLSSLLFSSIIALNIQVVTGINPSPDHWPNRIFFMTMAIVWSVFFCYIIDFLNKTYIKFSEIFLVVGIIFCVSLSIHVVHAEVLQAKEQDLFFIPSKNLSEAYEWLNENTLSDSVILSPSIVTNIQIPILTNLYTFLPIAGNSIASNSEIEERLFFVYKFFNIEPEFFKNVNILETPDESHGSVERDPLFYYFGINTDGSADIFFVGERIVDSFFQKELEQLYEKYKNFDYSTSTKYKLDYVFAGPREINLGGFVSDNLEFLEEVYNNGNVKIYKYKN